MRYLPEGGFAKSYKYRGPSKIVSAYKGGNTFWKHLKHKRRQAQWVRDFVRNLKDTARPATDPAIDPTTTKAEKRGETRTRLVGGTSLYHKVTQRILKKPHDNPAQTTYTPCIIRGTSGTLPSDDNQQGLVDNRLNATKTKEILQRYPLYNSHNTVTGPSTLIAAYKMQSRIQFITTPTADTPGTALLLHFDDKRYLIGNIHEGTQRACIQRGQKLLKVSDIFLTGKTEWKNTGGLIGMVLTLADATNSAAISAAEKINEKNFRKSERQTGADGGNIQSLGSSKSKKAVALTQQAVQPTLTVHGGPNITHTLATARRFVFRKGMPVDVAEYTDDGQRLPPNQDWEPTWADTRIQVWAMPISPSVTQQASATPSPKSPRKRPFDAFAEREAPSSIEAANWEESTETSRFAQERQGQKFCKSVVTEMFNSAWRHDNLVETPLRDVQMPAALFTRNPDSNKLERYTGPVPDGITPMPAINVLVRRPWPGAAIDHLPFTKPSSISMSYIVRSQKQRGKFLPARAKELKVPEGPLWNILATGHSVQSRDDVTIKPEMVLEEAREGAGVAVIDLPSTDYVDNLVNRSEWKVDRIMTGVGAIIWLLGPGVGQNKTLKKFMHEHEDLKHIVSSQDYCHNYLSMDSSAAAAVRLNQLDPSHYAIPVHDNINLLQRKQSQIETDLSVDCIQAQRGFSIKTGPSFQIQATDVVPNLDLAAILQEAPRDVLELAQAAREAITTESKTNGAGIQSLPSQDAEIIFLGTGSALPSKYRNVSATLVRVPGYGSYLLDCGENTLGQLKRVFTPPELAEVFRDLRLIWISHLHADHHLGTVSVIKAWYEEVHCKKDGGNSPRKYSLSQQPQDPVAALRQGKKLSIASHISMLKWLREYSSVEDYGYDQLIPLNCFPVDTKSSYYSIIEWNKQMVSFHPDNPTMREAMIAATGLSNLVCCLVSHCYGAMAVSLTFPNGFKVSYSGDCRPSKAFAKIGRDSTVLIHEATFDDELQGDADAKKHSTTSEAIGVAVAMRAKRLLLTHFSQRYQKIPIMEGLANVEVKLEDTEEAQDVMNGMDEAGESADAMIAAAESMAAKPKANDKAKNRESEDFIPSIVRPTAEQQALKDLKIGVAFDYMRVKVGEIAQLEKFSPALVKLFEEPEVEETESDPIIENKEVSEKAVKRKKNKEDWRAAQKQVASRDAIDGGDTSRGISSPGSRPWGRNAERAERDRAVLAVTEARNLETARRA